jgi:hypothetical protein
MSEPMMPIAHAPRLEVVLSPEGKPGPEWSEIPADALYDAYVIVYTPEGDNTKLLLDNGPFDHERGRNLILAIATTVAEKYAPSRVRAGALPSSHLTPSCGSISDLAAQSSMIRRSINCMLAGTFRSPFDASALG